MRPVSGRSAPGLSEAAFGALLLLPAALLLALVVVVPIGRLVWLQPAQPAPLGALGRAALRRAS